MAIYVVDKTTSEVIKQDEPVLAKNVLERARRIVQAQFKQAIEYPWCLHPLGITRWGEHNGALWHKQGRKAQ
jgi:hypothetical protein